MTTRTLQSCDMTQCWMLIFFTFPVIADSYFSWFQSCCSLVMPHIKKDYPRLTASHQNKFTVTSTGERASTKFCIRQNSPFIFCWILFKNWMAMIFTGNYSTDLVIYWSQLLAMSTPRSIEFYQHILIFVECHFIKVAGHQNLHWRFIPILWQILW